MTPRIRIATNGQSLTQAEAGACVEMPATSVCYPPCFSERKVIGLKATGMNNKMKGNAMMMAALAMAMAPGESMMFTGRGDEARQVWPPPKREERPPAGCKTYWFKANGEFSSERMLKSETVFECFAINDRNAIRKFKQWQSSHGG